MAIVNKTMHKFNVVHDGNTISYEIVDKAGRKMAVQGWADNSAKAFAAGEYVEKDGKLYKFKTSHAAGSAWNASEVEETNICSELTDLKSAIEEISSTIGQDTNSKSLWELGKVKTGSSGGAVISDDKTIVTTNMITDDLEFNIVEEGFYFVVALYTSDGTWKGFYNESDGTPTTNWYNGKQLSSITYADILSSFPNYKIRIQIKNTSNIYPISTDDYNALTITSSNIYTKSQTDTLLNGYVKKQQEVSDAGKALVIGQDGVVIPGDVSIDIDATLTQTGEAADAKATGDAIKASESSAYTNISQFTGNKSYQFINGGKIKNGSTINITPETDVTYCYAVIPCTEGDIFNVCGESSYNYRVWTFATSNYARISVAENYPITTPTKIVAPENAAYLIVNSLIASNHAVFSGVAIQSKVDITKKTADQRNAIKWEKGWITATGEENESNTHIRTTIPIWLKKGTEIWCGLNNHFFISKYDLYGNFIERVSENARQYTTTQDGLYRFDVFENIDEYNIDTLVPYNELVFIGKKQNYDLQENNAINFALTQVNPFKISDDAKKMAHVSSHAWDGNTLWIVYYGNETTTGENNTDVNTYLEIAKINPYTRTVIGRTTFKVGDSIGAYTQTTRPPYDPMLTVLSDYILITFWAWENSQYVISTFRVDKDTLALSNYSPLRIKNGSNEYVTMNCDNVESIYNAIAGTSLTNVDIIGFASHYAYYDGYYYQMLNTCFATQNINSILIKSADLHDWEIVRVMTECGAAQETSIAIRGNYAYISSREGNENVVRYGLVDGSVLSVPMPLYLQCKTDLCLHNGEIILACNIECVRDSSVSNNRKNMGFFAISEDMHFEMRSRIITESGMHYPDMSSHNDELYLSWSTDERYLNRNAERSRVMFSRIVI